MQKKRKTNQKIVIAYWSIRGYAQPIRLMLEHLGVEYEDKRYDPGLPGAPDYKQSWFKEKETIGFAFPNLPYLIDEEGNKLTQSNAIVNFIGRRHGLFADNLDEMNMLMDTVLDLRQPTVRLCYSDTFHNDRVGYLEGISGNHTGLLHRFEQWLASRKSQWMCGAKLTVVDFVFCELLDVIQLIGMEGDKKKKIDVLKQFPHLKKLKEKFFALPNIAAYVRSDRCIVHPINNPHSTFH